MTTQLSTGVIGGALDTTALDTMIRVLLGGARVNRHADSIGLAAALTAPTVKSADVLMACGDDITLKFGVQVQELGILSYSSGAVAVAFVARPVAGMRAETLEQRKEREYEEARERERQDRLSSQRAAAVFATRPVVHVDRDPVWLLWPWGRRLPSNWQDRDYMMGNLAAGVASMLNGLWGAAINPLQLAAQQALDGAAREDLFLVRRAIATNINLAVRYSHEGAPA